MDGAAGPAGAAGRPAKRLLPAASPQRSADDAGASLPAAKGPTWQAGCSSRSLLPC